MAEPSASVRIAIAAEHSVEAENVDYRRTLIDVAFDAIWASPWFGGIDIYTVEGSASLTGGGGFIDVVNSYVGILLTSGFVGLFLFLGLFATICLGVYGATKQTRRRHRRAASPRTRAACHLDRHPGVDPHGQQHLRDPDSLLVYRRCGGRLRTVGLGRGAARGERIARDEG